MGSRFHGFNRQKRKGAFTPQMTWKADEMKFVQFLTPFEDIPEVLFHQFIKVGVNEDTGKDQFMDFVSRRDPAIDGDDGYDPIWDRGWEPKAKKLAYAVELDALMEAVKGRQKVVGFTPQMRTFTGRDGSDRTVLDVKLIVQSGFTFWDNLDDLHADRPVNEHVWKITRRGARQDTRYSFIDMAPAAKLGIEDDQIPNADEYAMGLAAADRLKVIDALPANYRLAKYGGPARLKDDQEEEESPPWNDEKPEAKAEEYEKLRTSLSRNR